MTIGEFIEKYCKSSGITNQRFAELCGVSKGYISQLINGRNPKTGKPITPTIETYIRMAETMNITLDEMFSQLDDVPVALKKKPNDPFLEIGEKITSPTRSKEWTALSEGFEKMEQQRHDEFMAIFNMLKATKPEYFKGDDDNDPES